MTDPPAETLTLSLSALLVEVLTENADDPCVVPLRLSADGVPAIQRLAS